MIGLLLILTYIEPSFLSHLSQNHMWSPGNAASPYSPLALWRWHLIRACVWLVDSICRYVMLCHRMPAIIYAKLPQWSHAKLHTPSKYWVSSGLHSTSLLPMSTSPFGTPCYISTLQVNFPFSLLCKVSNITYQWLTLETGRSRVKGVGSGSGARIDFYGQIYAAITNHLGPLLTGPHHWDTSTDCSVRMCVCVGLKLTYP